MRFPVIARKFPVRLKKFPVPSLREFAKIIEQCQHVTGKFEARLGCFCKNSLFFPCLTGKSPLWPQRQVRRRLPAPPKFLIYTRFFNELYFIELLYPQINPQFRRRSRPLWAPAPPPAPCFLENASRRHHGGRPQDAFRGPFRPKSATLADYDLGGPVAAVIAAGQSWPCRVHCGTPGALWCSAGPLRRSRRSHGDLGASVVSRDAGAGDLCASDFGDHPPPSCIRYPLD